MPPPSPPPPPSFRTAPTPSRPAPPVVSENAPHGALLLELLVYSGAPFNDHWAYFIRSSSSPNTGVYIDAQGDVRNGFELQLKRDHDLLQDSPRPSSRIPLQWIECRPTDEQATLDGEDGTGDQLEPLSGFERSVFKVKAPVKTLNTVIQTGLPRKVVQRNCQTWVVEAADQLVEDGILHPDVATYLHATKQVM
ncbi:hypothetical protein HG530_012409 [Fusarium avenaceum]|nr:hypothetical protein DER45DRAFT_618625 [Fusarium avenaceum]KAI6754657.1 hypothetical protein HG530_012409 [Fusarium avenaceum]